jgi:hypothetical protein
MLRRKWSWFAIAGILAIVLTIGGVALYWYVWPLTHAGTEAIRIRQTEELLSAAKQHPTGEFPQEESIPGYLWGVGEECWRFIQSKVAKEPARPMITIADKSPDRRYHWVTVRFSDSSWIKLTYYQGLLFSLCEKSGP